MSIKKRKNPGGSVSFRATHCRGYDPETKRKLVNAKCFARRDQAVEWLAEQKRKWGQGTWAPPTTMTVDAFLDQWEKGGLQLGDQRAQTKATYVAHLKSYIRPHLGSIRLDRLSEALVQECAAKLLATPKTFGGKVRRNPDGTPTATLSPKTARRALAALLVALDAAVKQRLIGANPARGIKIAGSTDQKPVCWLTDDEATTLMDKTADDPLGALWALLLTTGMRPSEAIGLTWDHVDLQAGIVRVVRVLIPVKQPTDSGPRWRFDKPKTAKSRRAIKLRPETIARLKAHRARQNEERLKLGAAYAQHGFVFCDARGEPGREDAALKQFQSALERHGLPKTTLYALRHTHATLLRLAGVSMKSVSERLGHSSITLTADTYTHVSEEMDTQDADRFDAYMNAAQTRAAK